MEQYFAYENTGNGKKVYPLVDQYAAPRCECDETCFGCPAIELDNLAGSNLPAKVCPVVEIAGKPCVVMMHMMSGIPAKEIGESVADLTDKRASHGMRSIFLSMATKAFWSAAR